MDTAQRLPDSDVPVKTTTWDPSCSYGAHSWVRHEVLERGDDKWFFKQCTGRCGGVYQCTNAEWSYLPDPNTPVVVPVKSFSIYVAGPMSGYEHCNHPAFDNATWHLRGTYPVTVISPVEADRALGLDAHTLQPEEFSEEDWQDAMRRDFRLLLDCDGIALLPGWERSRGANAELTFGRIIGLEVFLYDPEEGLIWWPADVE